ncbi:MAG: histidine phosphatase family protein [Candidatus Dadabacteria bacterium]|nr:histidine phosphatase family protein [Candidatus Dadabacteria bacterium]
MDLFLIRHGETEWNRVGRCQGISDIELNGAGMSQATLLAESLRNLPVSAVYSSDLKRAVTTAAAIAGLHGLDVVVEPALREMDQGRFEGLSFVKIKQEHRELLDRWRESPELVTVPGGETLGEVQNRAYRVIQRISDQHHGETVVVVSHHFVIATLLCKILGLPLREFGSFSLKAACKNHLSYSDGRFSVELINDVTHLNGMDFTGE